MRLTQVLLCSSLAAGVMGVPGRYQARSAPASSTELTTAATSTSTTDEASTTTEASTFTTTSQSSTKTETTTSATETYYQFKVKEVCDHGQMNKENWNKYEMDIHSGVFWHEYPKDIFFNTGTYYLGNIIDSPNSKCTITEPDCNIFIQDVDKCKDDDLWGPMAYFTLWSLQNFHGWVYFIVNQIRLLGTEVEAEATDIVTKFTNHDVSDNSDSSYLAITSSVLGMLSPLMFGCEACSVGLGIGSAAIGLGSGILGATADSASEILENQFSNVESLSVAMANVTEVIAQAIEQVGIDVLETPPTAELPRTAPEVLKGGAFADPYSGDEWQKAEKQIKNAFSAAAINAAWSMDKVFIAKGKDKFHGTDLDGFDMQTLGNENRVCDDDSDYCYFFICAQNFDHFWKGGSGSWVKPTKGVDKLADYNITGVQFAQAADWFQNKYGSYLVQPKASDILETLRGGDDDDDSGPPHGLFVNMPVVDFDKAPPMGANSLHYSESTMTPREEVYFANELAKYVRDLHH